MTALVFLQIVLVLVFTALTTVLAGMVIDTVRGRIWSWRMLKAQEFRFEAFKGIVDNKPVGEPAMTAETFIIDEAKRLEWKNSLLEEHNSSKRLFIEYVNQEEDVTELSCI